MEEARSQISRTCTIIDTKVGTLLESRDLLERKIGEAGESLEQHQKHSMGSKIYDQNSVMTKPAKNQKEKEGIDCYDMLEQIKAKIDPTSQKEPIQLIYVSSGI